VYVEVDGILFTILCSAAYLSIYAHMFACTHAYKCGYTHAHLFTLHPPTNTNIRAHTQHTNTHTMILTTLSIW